MTNYLLSYDISEDRLRTKLAKLLLRLGCERIQKSVFIAPNFKAEELQQLRYEVDKLLEGNLEPQDSLLCLNLSARTLRELLWQGDVSAWQKRYAEVLHWLV